MTKIRKSTWNTYRMTGYSYDVANDQRSAGGVHYHQVRFASGCWQLRIRQSNGRFSSYSEVEKIDDAEGEAAYALAREY